ncbi:hypothetical protein ACTJI8_17395 [Microbacterium sp. 22303]|uniref:hypothetical protein n=1 Tax=Microbacterium sp. 22303 TaxID=3453905 RepID=UPI003F83C364
MQSYLDEVIRPRLQPLKAETVAPEAIVDYLLGLHGAFHNLSSMPASNGCLLINAAGAPIARDPQVSRLIADYRTELHDAIAQGIRAHHSTRSAAGEPQLADAVTNLVVAAFALARIDSAQAAQSIETAVRLFTGGDATSSHS